MYNGLPEQLHAYGKKNAVKYVANCICTCVLMCVCVLVVCVHRFGWSSTGGGAAALRGPIVSGLVTQLATGTDWGSLDVLLVRLLECIVLHCDATDLMQLCRICAGVVAVTIAAPLTHPRACACMLDNCQTYNTLSLSHVQSVVSVTCTIHCISRHM